MFIVVVLQVLPDPGGSIRLFRLALFGSFSVIDKAAYSANFGIVGEWPIWGKPLAMYVDNGTEFHSEALRRGCAQHGIQASLPTARATSVCRILNDLLAH